MAAIWGEHAIEPEATRTLALGPLTLRVRLVGPELLIAYDRADDGVPPPEADARWSRYILAHPTRRILLRPVLPDRPVVVKPEVPFHLGAGGSARIFVRIPASVRIEAASPTAPNLLCEVATILLRKTWFGTHTEGELCYYKSSAARREIGADPDCPHLVVCPIEVRNASSEPLQIEKLCLRVPHLSLYDDGVQLWADETRVSYRGKGQVSRLEFGGRAPREAPAAAAREAPRRPAYTGLAARTFLALRNLSSLGLDH